MSRRAPSWFAVAFVAALSNDVEVLLEALRPPFEENLLCTRACRDRAICPCIERPEVAIASVVVALDVDGDGALSLHEAREARRAEGQALVAWSTRRYVPPPIRPYFWEQNFPDGIEAGTCAYHLRHLNRLADQFLRPKTAEESVFDAIPCNGWDDCRDLEPIL